MGVKVLGTTLLVVNIKESLYKVFSFFLIIIFSDKLTKVLLLTLLHNIRPLPHVTQDFQILTNFSNNSVKN